MKTLQNRKSRAGFTLIEIAIALGTFAFAIVAILGVLLVGMNTSRDTIGSQVAANIANSIANDLSSTPAQSVGIAYSPRFYISNQIAKGTTLTYYFDQLGNILPTVTGAAYRATLTYQSISNPATSGTPAPDSVDILVTWPAAATVTTPKTYTGSYEVIVKSPQ